ncbi:MAG TPA: hypothetical protein VD735_02670 [Candidatus Saccharimonadales bacterium]|nr:hypothetical protein [Candidatus Saccharimonadales bacterium]
MSMWLLLLIDIAAFGLLLFVVGRSLKRTVTKLAQRVRQLLNPDYAVTPKELMSNYREHGKQAIRPALSHMFDIGRKTYPQVTELAELAAKARLLFFVFIGLFIASWLSLIIIAVVALVRALA